MTLTQFGGIVTIVGSILIFFGQIREASEVSAFRKSLKRSVDNISIPIVDISNIKPSENGFLDISLYNSGGSSADIVILEPVYTSMPFKSGTIKKFEKLIREKSSVVRIPIYPHEGLYMQDQKLLGEMNVAKSEMKSGKRTVMIDLFLTYYSRTTKVATEKKYQLIISNGRMHILLSHEVSEVQKHKAILALVLK